MNYYRQRIVGYQTAECCVVDSKRSKTDQSEDDKAQNQGDVEENMNIIILYHVAPSILLLYVLSLTRDFSLNIKNHV